MTSTRLPGKPLMPAAGRPMLAHLVDRLRRVPSLDGIVIATTVNATDDPIVAAARAMDVPSFRGSEPDVMARVLGAADSAGADVIVEVTGDCPMSDPSILEQLIRLFRHNACDYANNVEVRSYPAGMDAQVFTTAALRRASELTQDPFMREHVTPYIRRNPQLFSRVTLVAPPELTWPTLPLLLDEKADYEFLRTLYEHFLPAHPAFTCADIMRVLREEHPEWLEINRAVARPALKNLKPL